MNYHVLRSGTAREPGSVRVHWPRRAVFNIGTQWQHGGSCSATAQVRFQQELVKSPSLTAEAKRLILEKGDYRSMRARRNIPLNRFNFAKENRRGAL